VKGKRCEEPEGRRVVRGETDGGYVDGVWSGERREGGKVEVFREEVRGGGGGSGWERRGGLSVYGRVDGCW
jgi:hypothetical protein